MFITNYFNNSGFLVLIDIINGVSFSSNNICYYKFVLNTSI